MMFWVLAAWVYEKKKKKPKKNSSNRPAKAWSFIGKCRNENAFLQTVLAFPHSTIRPHPSVISPRPKPRAQLIPDPLLNLIC